ncbi:MAG: hypothetical protein CSA64_03930 [Arachnia propionica]|nr:MAG: hypothetical protein CSA64_03930 [Arachnia propionica]
MRAMLPIRRAATADEAGAGTLLSAAAAVIIVMCGGLLLLAGGLLTQLQQTQNAADLTALAGAAALAEGNDACSAARAAAQHNSAELVACQVHQAPGSFVVAVRVERRLPPNRLLADVRLVRAATAGTT